MTKWEVTWYLIEAKKSIDSLIYIDYVKRDNKLKMRNLATDISKARKDFILNLAYVLEEFINQNKGEFNKRDLCNKYPFIDKVFFERDKNQCHKDSSYIPPVFKDLSEEIDNKIETIEKIRNVCKTILPSILTLDYVPHDPTLFRYLHGVDSEQENRVLDIKNASNLYHAKKYSAAPMRFLSLPSYEFCGVEDIRKLEEFGSNSFYVRRQEGINLFENFQNNQDWCIKSNIVADYSHATPRPNAIWYHLNKDSDTIELFQYLKENEMIDPFGLPILDTQNKKKLWKEFYEKHKDLTRKPLFWL